MQVRISGKEIRGGSVGKVDSLRLTSPTSWLTTEENAYKKLIVGLSQLDNLSL